MSAPDIRIVGDDRALAIAFAIRDEVFVGEQAVPIEEERDDDDATATHVLAFVGEQPIGTGRLVAKDGRLGKIGRMAVRKEARGIGVGRAIMAALIARAREMGLLEIILDAQVHAIPFYADLGFVEEGDEFMDAGLVHRRMRRRL
jgi:predicted GNAT family N-acyltransferase